MRLRRLPSRVALVDLIAARPDLLRAHRAPIGVGGDDAGPVTIGPELGRGLLVCGPPGSGRSTALATLAEALTRAGRSVVTVGDDIAAAPLRRAPEVLDALRRRPTSVLLLDAGAHTLPGIDELADRYLTDDLDAAGTPGTAGLRLVVTCTATEAAVAFRGAIAQLRALRCALLLGPRTVADGEAVGARVGACDALEPGRGLLVVRGRTARVQIALPSMTSAGDLDATRADSPPGPEVGENDHRV